MRGPPRAPGSGELPDFEDEPARFDAPADLPLPLLRDFFVLKVMSFAMWGRVDDGGLAGAFTAPTAEFGGDASDTHPPIRGPSLRPSAGRWRYGWI
jgi:hypothetical protein